MLAMAIPFRFIHAADLHIDSPFKGLTTVPDYVRESLIEATFLAFKRLVALAIQEQVQFIVVSGDLFDESDRSLKAQLFLLKQYEELGNHHIEIYIIHGNHDHLAGERVQFPYPNNVHIFSSSEVTTMPACDANGEILAYVHGISYPTRHVRENLATRFQREPLEGYHIGLYHGNVGHNSEHDPYAPCQLSDLLAHNYDYWALGHIHKRQVLHQHPFVVYPGNTQGRHRKESGDKGCYIVSVNTSHETTIHFYPLAPVRWSQLTLDISVVENESQFLDVLHRQLEALQNELDNCHALLSLELTGSGYMHELLLQAGAIEQLLEHIQYNTEPAFSQNWLYIYELIDHTQPYYDEELLRQEQSFIGDFLACYEEVVQDQDQMLQLFAEARQLLLQHQGVNRHLRDALEIDEALQREQLADAKQYVLEWLLRRQSQEVNT